MSFLKKNAVIVCDWKNSNKNLVIQSLIRTFAIYKRNNER